MNQMKLQDAYETHLKRWISMARDVIVSTDLSKSLRGNLITE